MSTRGPYVLAADQVWYGFNRPDIPAPGASDGFLTDVTRPVWLGTGNINNNVGCLFGVPRTTVATVTQATGAVHQNLTITGQITITAKLQTFRNCRFTYGYTGTGNGGMAYQMASVTNANQTNFEFCEFEPDIPNDRYNAIYGHDFKAHRCALAKSCDGAGAYNSTARNVNAELSCCWIGYLSWFNDDRGVHTDGTHNDGIQLGSGWFTDCHGCFWQGAKFNALNPDNCVLSADGMDFTIAAGNGVTPLALNSGNLSNRNPQQGQLFLGQHSAYYTIRHIRFVNNWCWNFDHGFKLMSNLSASTGNPIVDESGTPQTVSGRRPVTDVEFTGNRFGGTPRNWGSSWLYYPARWDSNCTVNGVQRTAGGTFVDTDDNLWDASANVAATYPGDGAPIAGQPIRQRVDLVAVP